MRRDSRSASEGRAGPFQGQDATDEALPGQTTGLIEYAASGSDLLQWIAADRSSSSICVDKESAEAVGGIM